MKKALVIIVSMVYLGTYSAVANAYYLAGKVWTSTASVKTPYAFTGNYPSSLVSAASAGNLAWDSLSGSALNTGSLTYTPSSNTYANAALKLSYQNVKTLTGMDVPGATFALAGSNSASVYLNSTWTWGTSFDQTNKKAVARTVLTHEFGHAYGLDHPAKGGPMTAAEIASVMNATNSVKNTPNSDDIAGIAAMY
jgi:hypothetical protein